LAPAVRRATLARSVAARPPLLNRPNRPRESDRRRLAGAACRGLQ